MTKQNLISVLLLAIFASYGCVTDDESPGQVDQNPFSTPPNAGSSSGQAPTAPAETQAPPPATPDPCNPFSFENSAPYFHKEHSYVITKVLKSCTTREKGLAGYLENSPWMAMGLPCTGGEGQISIIGNYTDPKSVSFLLSTDCPMIPNDLDDVNAYARSLGFTEGMPLLAYNSFLVQYWEIPGLIDAGTGFSVKLGSLQALDSTWKQFRRSELELPVIIYGRENAWANNNQMYRVSGTLTLTEPRKFQLKVSEVELMTKEDITHLRDKCFSLRPRQNCNDVFSGY